LLHIFGHLLIAMHGTMNVKKYIKELYLLLFCDSYLRSPIWQRT